MERGVRQVEPGGVEHAEVGVFHGELVGASPRGIHHLLHHVARDEETVWAQTLGGEKAGVAWARGELEDRLTSLRVEQLHQTRGEHLRRVPEQRAAPLPAGRDDTPRLDLVGRCAVAHAGARENCGITSLPYAASVSSWPCVIR